MALFVILAAIVLLDGWATGDLAAFGRWLRRKTPAGRRAELDQIGKDYLQALGLTGQPLWRQQEPEPEDSWALAGLESTAALIARIDREIQKGYEAWLEGSVATPHPDNREIIERPVAGNVRVLTYGEVRTS